MFPMLQTSFWQILIKYTQFLIEKQPHFRVSKSNLLHKNRESLYIWMLFYIKKAYKIKFSEVLTIKKRFLMKNLYRYTFRHPRNLIFWGHNFIFLGPKLMLGPPFFYAFYIKITFLPKSYPICCDGALRWATNHVFCVKIIFFA